MCSGCHSYRLAPEVVFPGQYEDAMAASRAFLSAGVRERYGLDPQRLCVSGDSAGGNLAAAVAQEVSPPTVTLGLRGLVRRHGGGGSGFAAHSLPHP